MYAICAFCSCAQGPIAVGPNRKGETGGRGKEREGRKIVVVFPNNGISKLEAKSNIYY